MLRSRTLQMLQSRAAVSHSRALKAAGFVASRSFHATGSMNAKEDPNKTPVQVFFDTFRTELKKSKELQEEIKALQDETGRLAESSAFKRAKDALDKTREAKSFTGRGIKKAGEALGGAASTTWNSAPVRLTRDVASKTADAVDTASAPIRNTEFYKSVKEVIDDGSSIRYGGFESREQRLARREKERKMQQELDRAAGRSGPVKENLDAGENVIVHETAKPDIDLNKTALGKKLAGLKTSFNESDNALVSSIRGITDAIGGFFAETESGQVARMFKDMDPTFTQERFLKELRQYILPEVLDAYVRGQTDVLQTWLSEASYNVYNQLSKEYREKGLYSAGRVLDIRGADIMQAKLLQPANIPVYVVSCRAQETNVYKNIKTDEVKAGVEDQILLSTYVMVLTRIPEDMENEETRGWKILEMIRGKSQNYV